MNKFIFPSFQTINYDVVFDIWFVNLSAFTNVKEICNSNGYIRIELFEFKKIPLFKTANSPVENVRVEKRGSTYWSKIRRISFQKIDLQFDYWNPGPNRPIFRDIRGRNILAVINAIKSSSTTTITKTALPLMFSLFFLCKHKLPDDIEMASIVIAFCFYSYSFFP